jgi:hypothetical protein
VFRIQFCRFGGKSRGPIHEQLGNAGAELGFVLGNRFMKFYSPTALGQVAGLCCRQSPLRGAIGGLIGCAVVVGATFLVWYMGAPWVFWGGFAALAAILVPFVLRDILAKFRATNWVMWIGPDDLLINLRSYQNPHLADAATVLQLSYPEIARAHRHVETWTTPSEGNGLASTYWKEESLELHLAPDETGKISETLCKERGRWPPGPEGAIRSKATHQSVTVPAEGVLRIAWRGNSNDVAPSLDRALGELSRHGVKIAAPTRTARPEWSELSDAEQDELVAKFIRTGDRLEAQRLLTRRRGCSATEAHRLIERLDAKV